MKVVHCGNVPLPPDHPEFRHCPQHAGRWVLNHAIAQKQFGLDVEIVSQAHKASQDFTCEIEGIKVHFLRTFHPYRHLTLYAVDGIRMARYLRRLTPDIVHAHGTEAAYAHAAILSRLPFCTTAQGLFFQIIPALGNHPDINLRFLRLNEHLAWKRIHYAIAKSEYGLKALRERYPHLDVSLIYNTYEPSLDAPLKPREGHHIAFVGSADYRKGFHFLPFVFGKVREWFPDAVLHVIGNAPEGAGTDYEKNNVSNLRKLLGNRLILHGRVPSKTVFDILDSCTVLIAPSLEEMSGNQVTEGLMRGCHAIVFDGTGVSGIAKRMGNSSCVRYGDVEAFTQAVLDALAEEWMRDRCETARTNIRDLMGPDEVAREHAHLYSRILNS